MGLSDSRPEAERKMPASCRHSAQDKQEDNVEIQQEQVRKFAADHGVEIIEEFPIRA